MVIIKDIKLNQLKCTVNLSKSTLSVNFSNVLYSHQQNPQNQRDLGFTGGLPNNMNTQYNNNLKQQSNNSNNQYLFMNQQSQYNNSNQGSMQNNMNRNFNK